MTIKEHVSPEACELKASLLDNCTHAKVIYNKANLDSNLDGGIFFPFFFFFFFFFLQE